MAATRLLGRTLLGALALCGATLTPAAAAESEGDAPGLPADERAPITVLHLSAIGDRGADGYRTAMLRCNPAGGTHSSPRAACQSLSAAEGSFERLRTESENTLCPLIYRPITVTASGMWKDRSIDFEQTYPNACVMNAYTGPVFNF